MLRLAILLVCLTLCYGHAVLPLVVPAVHSVHAVAPYHGFGVHGYGHGYGLGYGHWFGGHGYSHGLGHNNLGHHVWKRSPHFVSSYSHGHHGHVEVVPAAISHQSRVDVHSSPAVVAPVVPVVKTVVAAPVYGDGHFGGHLGTGYYGAGHYDAGHYGAGLYGAGHLGAGHYGVGHFGDHGHYGLSHLGHY